MLQENTNGNNLIKLIKRTIDNTYKDDDLRKELLIGANILIQLELLDFFHMYNPPSPGGYTFDNSSVIILILNNFKNALPGHSGSSMGLFVRTLKNIVDYAYSNV